jgi:UDP-N-acetylmuramoylalanine--D-glutamate ligase
MIRISSFRAADVAVFGLGLSGRAAARALAAGGARVWAWDDGEEARAAARAAGIAVRDLAATDFGGFSALVLAPGVPLTHPTPHWTVTKARAAGVAIIGDVELFCRERALSAPGAPLIAITGTNGKSTTTALIAHLLASAGREVALGGNIGIPVLELAPPAPQRVHVLELSSFQIELTPSLAPTIGVLINVSPDHLDRHGSMDAYAELKSRVVRTAGHAVVGTDDAWSARLGVELARAGARVEAISATRRLAHGWYAEGTQLVSEAAWTGPLGRFADLAGIKALRGRHNAQNALAASAAALIAGVDARAIARALATFPGLPHRLEEVATVGGIAFVNDSKATNPESTATALAAFDPPIFLILGGRAKPGGIASLKPYLARLAKAYLIGEAQEEFAAALEGQVAFERAGVLARAVEAAARDAAEAGRGIVLLSPACASYDQFRDFEARGEAFCRLVAGLPGVAPARGVAP